MQPQHTYGQAPAGPGPAPKSRLLVNFLVAFAVTAAILAVAGGGWYFYQHKIAKDSGVEACKAMRDNAAANKTTGKDKLTEARYQEMRKQFADSRYDGIRDHGTRLMDIVWQVDQFGDDPGAAALAYMSPMMEQVTGLQSACADQGVIVTIKAK